MSHCGSLDLVLTLVKQGDYIHRVHLQGLLSTVNEIMSVRFFGMVPHAEKVVYILIYDKMFFSFYYVGSIL